MSLSSSVVWRDGLFIKPQHFQQQQRYLESLVRAQADHLSSYRSGLHRLEIDAEALMHGKITVRNASGVFPDGTVFEMPDSAPTPTPLDVSTTGIANEVVFLALPLSANGVADVLERDQANDATRMLTAVHPVRDNASIDPSVVDIDLARHRITLMLEGDDRSSHTCLPIARIAETRADGGLVLDTEFLPSGTTLGVMPRLQRVLEDFVGLMNQRSRQIAGRIGSPSQAGVPEVTDFLMLQTMNRLEPVFKHYASLRDCHPIQLYELMVQAAGELATFTHQNRLPSPWPAYNHDEPHLSFDPVITSLRQSLSAIFEPNAIALPLQKMKFGITTAPVADRGLYDSCIFVLAVQASVPLERLAREFPSQTKVASIENIRDLINLHLPGISLQPLPSVPRQLPYHAGFTYFQLDKNSPSWKSFRDASGFAFHIAGNFPDLQIQFWAIRT